MGIVDITSRRSRRASGKRMGPEEGPTQPSDFEVSGADSMDSGFLDERASCARTLPFSYFPGFKHSIRLESGIRVHFPVVRSEEEDELTAFEAALRQFQPRLTSTPVKIKEGSVIDQFLLKVWAEDGVKNPIVMKTRSMNTFDGCSDPEGTFREDPKDDRTPSLKCCKCKFTAKLYDGSLMVLHFKEVHQENLFVCGGCPGSDKVFYRASSLKSHVLRNHDQDQETLLSSIEEQISLLNHGTHLASSGGKSSAPRKRSRSETESGVAKKMPKTKVGSAEAQTTEGPKPESGDHPLSHEKRKLTKSQRSKAETGKSSTYVRNTKEEQAAKYVITLRPTVECDFCDQVFMTFDKRDAHYKSQHKMVV